MPLRDDLLAPIPGENPAGSSLRYDRVYDQIKEARSEDDDTLPSGAWARQAKKADFRVVTKLAGDALATRSKDLQLAAWLGEALFKQEGISALAPVLRLFLDLQQTYWDTLHPEIDEGDAGMRAAPLQWAANRYATLLYAVNLTRKGITFPEYKTARALGTEEEAGQNEQKRVLRAQAVAEGKPTSEEVDAEIAATPKAFYVALDGSLATAEETLQELEIFCEEKYGDDGPTFRKLREALQEVHNLVSALLREKRRIEPDPVEEPQGVVSEEVPPQQEIVAPSVTLPQETIAAAAPLPAEPRAPAVQSRTPDSWDDALSRIDEAVAYMTAQQPESPMPFVLRSALRFAQLREIAAASRFDMLDAPSTELRQALKRAAAEGDWTGVHREGLSALAAACGCGWLDLYRYLWTSCLQLGWHAQQLSIAAAVQQCLREFPDLPTRTLNDDTPTANAETLLWIAAEIAPPPVAESAPQNQSAAEMRPTEVPVLLTNEAANEPAEDAFDVARRLAARGDIQGAIQMLARDAAQQTVGRLRYQRNLQIATLCVESGKNTVAVPLLQGLIREVEERKLETWEPRESAARPYALLLQCGSAAKLDTATIFGRLCAIDPSAALTIAPGVEG